ncbi:MAG: hypothetical protein EOM62_14385 [Bacteroidia bacterium]|nr:hypothetical protein [Bacteroidia bacterium]
MKISIACGFFLIFIFSAPCIADPGKEPANYCKDAASWKEWHELLKKHPQDDAIHALYATRLGLCSMVESRTIDLDRATRIFENMRESLLGRYREQGEMEPEERKRAM